MDTIRNLLKSRKFIVAVATIIATFAAEKGFNVSEEALSNIFWIGATLIAGIAGEDAARKFALPPTP